MRRSVLGVAILFASACTYAPEEERVVIEQVVRIPDSYRGLVTVRHERFQRPTGLAAFPDGGRRRFHERVATLHLVDASTGRASPLIRQSAPDRLWESFGAGVAGLDADSVAYFRLTGCQRNGECYPPLRAAQTFRVTLSGDVRAVDAVPAGATLPAVMLARRQGEEHYVRLSTNGSLVTARFEEDGPFEPVFEVRDDGSLAGTSLVPSPGGAQDPGELRAQVAEAAEAFVDAFNDLDWERFKEAWTEDATAFMPMPEFPARMDGRDTIVSTFRSVFADFPDRFEGPPYLTIDPVDLRIDVVETAAVVTFHLGDEAPRSRRTLVFVQRDGAWRIAHLHASRPPI